MNEQDYEAYDPMYDEPDGSQSIPDSAGVPPAPTMDVVLIAPKIAPPDELPDLDGMEAGISLAPKYREFETEGETVRALFCGFTTMNSQQKATIPVAIFQNADGVFVNAGANLVQQVRALAPRTPVQITYTGKQKTKSGNQVKTFDVRLLIPRKQGGNGTRVHTSVDKPKAAPESEKVRWSKFLVVNKATEADIRQALGTARVSEWLNAKSGRTLDQAEKLVLDSLAPF